MNPHYATYAFLHQFLYDGVLFYFLRILLTFNFFAFLSPNLKNIETFYFTFAA